MQDKENTLTLNPNFEELELELENFEKTELLKIEIDQGLEEALKEFEDLKTKLPKEQAQSLITQCTDNAIDAVVGHFGLASAVLGAKDGGNVTTLHNFKQGITANEADKAKYNAMKKEQNMSRTELGYDHLKDKKRDASPDIVHSEMQNKSDFRGQRKTENGTEFGMELDHTISVDEIKNDPAQHLFNNPEGRKQLANDDINLSWLSKSANASKGDRDLMEWGNSIDKESGKTNFEKHGIDPKMAEKKYKEAKANINKQKNLAALKKYGTELLTTGAKDAAKMAVHTAIGIALKEFIQAMMAELKILFKEFGNESIKDIFKRFYTRLKEIWQKLKSSWKEMFAGSLEAGIQAFFSNFVVFIVNLAKTTLQSIVRIIRAGLTSLWSAIKFIMNPPENVDKDDVMFEAAKIFVTGLISSITMLGATIIEKWLSINIPALGFIFQMPIPFSEETIGGALSLVISAAGGAVLSTIAIYYMDKFRSENKIGKIKLQLVTQSGVVVQYKIGQTWGVLHDAYMFAYDEALKTRAFLFGIKDELEQNDKETKQNLQELQKTNEELKQLSNKGK